MSADFPLPGVVLHCGGESCLRSGRRVVEVLPQGFQGSTAAARRPRRLSARSPVWRCQRPRLLRCAPQPVTGCRRCCAGAGVAVVGDDRRHVAHLPHAGAAAAFRHRVRGVAALPLARHATPPAHLLCPSVLVHAHKVPDLAAQPGCAACCVVAVTLLPARALPAKPDPTKKRGKHALPCCRAVQLPVYLPSEEEKADPRLYADNVHAFMVWLAPL